MSLRLTMLKLIQKYLQQFGDPVIKLDDRQEILNFSNNL